MKRIFLIAVLLFLIGCQRKILVSDDFTQFDPQKWWVEEDSFGRTFVANGQLFVEINQPNTIQYATLRNLERADFSVQVDATLVSGGRSSQAILFRKQPTGAFYRFAISDNGTWSVDRLDAANTWVNLTPTGRWEKADVINRGLGQTNRLRVSAQGTIVVFEINDTVVLRNEQFDTAFLTGKISLSAGSFSQPGTRVAFDNFVVREP